MFNLTFFLKLEYYHHLVDNEENEKNILMDFIVNFVARSELNIKMLWNFCKVFYISVDKKQ